MFGTGRDLFRTGWGIYYDFGYTNANILFPGLIAQGGSGVIFTVPALVMMGAWQGYEGEDLEAVVDLGDTSTVTSVALGCLQDNNSWIFFPQRVEFDFSNDGTTFGDIRVVANTIDPRDEKVQIRSFDAEVALEARYVRVRGKNVGVCPEWHKGAGS